MLTDSFKAGAVYFTVVFAAGFILGPVRVILLVPRVGMMVAELIEAPIMLGVILLAARWIVRRFGSIRSRSGWLVAGFFALALLLVAEFTVVLTVRGLSVAEYVATRDPVSGSVYVLLLALFAVMPALVAKR